MLLKANKPNFRKRTSKFEKAVQKFASGREESRQDPTHMGEITPKQRFVRPCAPSTPPAELSGTSNPCPGAYFVCVTTHMCVINTGPNRIESNHPLTIRNLTGNAPRKHWVTKGRLSNPVVTGLFRRGQHSSIMNRALPLNELSQAYLENDLHRIIDLANKQSRSVGSSQDNGKAESRRTLVPRLYGQTESEAVDSPALQALVEPRQLSPLWQIFSPKASSTRMVHGGPYAPVSVGPPNKSTLNLSTISSSDEDDSHNLGYQAFSAACEKSVSAVSKRLCELCKYNHLQSVRRKLQDTFVKSTHQPIRIQIRADSCCSGLVCTEDGFSANSVIRTCHSIEYVGPRSTGCLGSSVKDYEDEGQLHFPASSATGMSPETRFASLVTSPPIVYWKRSMF
uniref:Uncharacterized protein n=1 Tax=Timema shepardi TaxID=629360 RepID=A0A7R9G3T2_TIMSH|nr:unnamed protein product [Timema shepardi]